MKIRIDPLDTLFSRYVRLRDKCCQKCGNSGNLQTAHYKGRRMKSVRFDPSNALAFCFSCHQYFHENPDEFVAFMTKRLGERELDLLNSRARTPVRYLDKEAIRLWLEQQIRRLE